MLLSKKKKVNVIDILPNDCISNFVLFYSSFSDVLNLCLVFKGFFEYLKYNNSYCLKNIVFRIYELPNFPITYVFQVEGHFLCKVRNLKEIFPNLVILTSSHYWSGFFTRKGISKRRLVFIEQNKLASAKINEIKSYSNLREINIELNSGIFLANLPKLRIARCTFCTDDEKDFPFTCKLRNLPFLVDLFIEVDSCRRSDYEIVNKLMLDLGEEVLDKLEDLSLYGECKLVGSNFKRDFPIKNIPNIKRFSTDLLNVTPLNCKKQLEELDLIGYAFDIDLEGRGEFYDIVFKNPLNFKKLSKLSINSEISIDGEVKIKNFVNLEVLDILLISNTVNIYIIIFSSIPNLKEIKFYSEGVLSHLENFRSIECCKKLEKISLSNIREQTDFIKFSDFENLKELKIENWYSNNQIDQQFSRKETKKIAYVKKIQDESNFPFRRIEFVGSPLLNDQTYKVNLKGKFKNLEKMSIIGNVNVVNFSLMSFNRSKLTKMKLCSDGPVSIPENLFSLQKLYVSCTKINNFGVLFGNSFKQLKELLIRIKVVPDYNNVKSETKKWDLKFLGFSNLKILSIEVLNTSSYYWEKCEIINSPNLRELQLYHSKKYILKNLGSLVYLKIVKAESIECEWSNLGSIKTIYFVNIEMEYGSLKMGGLLSSLENLKISNEDVVKNGKSISNDLFGFKNLSILILENVEVDEIFNLPNVEYLRIWFKSEDAKIEDLPKLKRLDILGFSKCTTVSLNNLPSLVKVKVESFGESKIKNLHYKNCVNFGKNENKKKKKKFSLHKKLLRNKKRYEFCFPKGLRDDEMHFRDLNWSWETDYSRELPPEFLW